MNSQNSIKLGRNARPSLPAKALIGFFLMTFAITWGLIGVYIFWPEWASENFGAISGSHPVFFAATWSPAMSAFAVVLFFSGTTGLKVFLSRLYLWRCSFGWIAFIFIFIPFVFIAGSLIKGGPALVEIPSEGVGSLVSIMFMMLFLGPIEEFGWRGIAQPMLQRHIAPIWAGIAIGVIWGFWHLPAFFLSGTVFAGWNYLPFFIGNVTLAILVTPLFNRTKGSLIWPMLFHWQLINPFWPDAQPYDTWILVAVTVIVVWWNRDTMFQKTGSVQQVLPSTHRMSSCREH